MTIPTNPPTVTEPATRRSAPYPVCGKKTRIVVTKGGGGSVGVFVRHDAELGHRCPNSRSEVQT